MPIKQPDDVDAADHFGDGVYPAELPPPRKQGDGAPRLDLSNATGLLLTRVEHIISPHL
ncbi:hypothetical protein [Lentzea guizhouensis]|uniref:hypothetical protein n=1 Tax=Lentzea guizhouensis TaxID=1586287 RepID=UPI001475EC66|nr:hypothetical protein [Lentzea guizhouensis]